MRFPLPRFARRSLLAALLALVSLTSLAACGSSTHSVGSKQAQGCGTTGGATTSSGASVSNTAYSAEALTLPATHSSPRKLTLGLTYIPNIQFAPFYVAEALGYYTQAGLDVTLRHHGFSEGEFDALVTGHEDAIFASGDETLQARSKGIPVTYVAQVFTRYPVALIVPSSSSIQSVKDLKGHTVGVPGYYGATYIGLLALLQCAGLSKSDVNIQAIGYTQVAALLGHKVDAVMGYSNNEVLQFQKANFAVRTFPVQQPFISNGLAALDSELSAHPDDIRALVAATPERGMAIARALDGGTNAVSMRPACAVKTHFGEPQSAAVHAQATAAVGLAARIVDLPGLAFDVDTPADLQELHACR